MLHSRSFGGAHLHAGRSLAKMGLPPARHVSETLPANG